MTKIFFYLYLLFITSVAFPQTAVVSDEGTIKTFFAKTALQEGRSSLYNGYEYRGYPRNFFKEGHQFFGNTDWNIGSVTYDGSSFTDVSILYDIIKDEIIIRSLDKSSSITLIKSKVKVFSFSGKTFINMPLISDDNESNYRYYEQLYGKKSTILAKRDKKIIESTTANGIERSVQLLNRYYALKDNTYYSFKTPKSLLNIFKDKKAQIKKHLAENHIKLTKDPESAIVAIAAYYDQISN